jgi:hypothetical protein
MACLPQPDDLTSLVLRTDFSDDRGLGDAASGNRGL